MKTRAIAIHVLLSLLLLFSQQLAAAHSVTHLAHSGEAGSSRSEQLPGEMQCATCLAFASIGSALHDALHSAPSCSETETVLAAVPIAGPANSHLHAFDPRAPPKAV